MEIWFDLRGYVGFYQLSNLKRIRSLDRTVIDRRGNTRRLRGRLMSPRFGSNATYLLSRDGEERWYTVEELGSLALREGFV